MRAISTAGLALIGSVGATASAQCPYPAFQEAQLVQGQGTNANGLGWSVAVDGDVAVLGAPFADPGGSTSAGEVVVFERQGKDWVQTTVLTAIAGNAHDQFGYSVDVDGDLIVVGAPHQPFGPSVPGFAYVFQRMQGVWVQGCQLIDPGSQPDDEFGSSIKIDGNRVIVGSPKANTGGFPNAGAASIFEYDSSTQTCQWRQPLLPPASSANALFGFSVGIHGNLAAVGSPNSSVTGNLAGAAYVYERNTTTNVWGPGIPLAGAASGDQFGYSVDVLNGATTGADRVVVGAIGYGGGAGRAFVHDRSFGVWGIQQQLNPVTGALHWFGFSVAIDAGRIAIGGPRDIDCGSNSGAIYLFRENCPVAGWNPTKKTYGADVVAGDWFGYSVGVSGETTLAGAYLHDLAVANAGTAYVFEATTEPFDTFGYGDGSMGPCPCTDSVVGHEQGCVNTTGLGAQSVPFGTASVVADDLCIRSYNLPNNPALLFVGPSANALGAPFGDGLLFVNGPFTRLGVQLPNALQEATWGPGLGATGSWLAGQTQYFQVWYRDPLSTCGSVFNLSNGVEATFY